jgi:hypothetical protein
MESFGNSRGHFFAPFVFCDSTQMKNFSSQMSIFRPILIIAPELARPFEHSLKISDRRPPFVKAWCCSVNKFTVNSLIILMCLSITARLRRYTLKTLFFPRFVKREKRKLSRKLTVSFYCFLRLTLLYCVLFLNLLTLLCIVFFDIYFEAVPVCHFICAPLGLVV